jgi:hypothetical protein
MLDEYGRVPNEVDWASDPIASGLKPALVASLHYEILRLAVEAFEKRTKGECARRERRGFASFEMRAGRAWA